VFALTTIVAQAGIVQSFKATVKPAKAKKPVALAVSESTGLTADDPGYLVKGQPPPQKQQIIRLNKGGKFNGKYFRRCRLASLQARGPSACSAGSKIGSGTGTGSAKPIVDSVSAKLTLFNGERKGGKDTVYVFVLPDIGPTFVVVGTIKRINRGGYGHELRFAIDPIKTLPNAPDAAIISVKTNTPKKSVRKSGKKRWLIEAPRTCRGKWRYYGEFRFVNGAKATSQGTMKCKR
jgi:hypothetical protein